MLVVTTLEWNAVEGGLQRYERSTRHGHWRAVGEPVSIVVGKNGLGWGEGLVTKEEPLIRSASDPVKKEGDGKAPAGIFRFSTAFGYAPQLRSGWRMPYLSLAKSVECVDDTNSKFYNQIVDRDQVAPDWNSSEHMLRPYELYRLGLVINHNASPSHPGGGSCIFMHIGLLQDEVQSVARRCLRATEINSCLVEPSEEAVTRATARGSVPEIAESVEAANIVASTKAMSALLMNDRTCRNSFRNFRLLFFLLKELYRAFPLLLATSVFSITDGGGNLIAW